MPRRLTKEEQANRDAHFAEHTFCWMCKFFRLILSKSKDPELHHIAGKGKRHEVRANYAALCARHHANIQSKKDSELLMLVLLREFAPTHYSPETICDLRGRADTCWTDLDVTRTERTMRTTQELLR